MHALSQLVACVALNNNGDCTKKKNHVRSFSCNVENLAALMSPGGTKHVHNTGNDNSVYIISMTMFTYTLYNNGI